MKREEYEKVVQRNEVLEEQLRSICNLIMKIKRKAEREGLWLSAGNNPYVPQTDEAQQGPLVTELYDTVEHIRKHVRNK